MTENGLMDGTRTEKLFYNDSHLSKFTAMVLECEPYEKKEGCYAVELDRTAFFPEGGGQYADTGKLKDVKVSDVREKNGLVYNVESNVTSYTDTGLASIYFGTDPKNKEKAIRLVYKELAKLREVKLTATQLAAAKKQVIGQLGVSGDNREGLFLGLGKSFLHYNRYDTLPEVFAKVEKLTAGEIREVANEIFAPERLFSLIYQ